MYLPEEKVLNVSHLCQKVIKERQAAFRKLASLTGKLTSTYQADLLPSLHSGSNNKTKAKSLLRGHHNLEQRLPKKLI